VEKFTRLAGVAAPMNQDNVDTDALIPVSHMKSLDADYGHSLFANLRYRLDGSEVPEFVLNRPEYRSTKILVAGANFGCGSSREHAVWALLGFGIRCVVAESFGDIFYDNALRVGLLPVVLPAPECRALLAAVEQAAGDREMVVDLAAQTLTGPDGAAHRFDIAPDRRKILLEGLDAIGITLLHEPAMIAFDRRDRAQRPWIYQSVAP
jgi:3-isopropylmalate/(R)-2-methylmalate dehydratase small subunit